MKPYLLRGDPQPIIVPVAAAAVINQGDIVYLDTTAKAAHEVAHATNLATTQEAVHDGFLGVALDQHLASMPAGFIRVATEGVWRFNLRVATTAKAIGQMYGVDSVAGGATGAALNDQLVATATANLSVGRLVKPTVAADTKVDVRIRGLGVCGGVQTMA